MLDDAHYDPLFALLVDSNMELPKIISLIEADTAFLSESLVKVFERRGMVVSYVKTLIAETVKTTRTLSPLISSYAVLANPQVLFRSNTLSTKSLDALMRIIALPHLHKILKATVTEIYKSKRPCEVLPQSFHFTKTHSP